MRHIQHTDMKTIFALLLTALTAITAYSQDTLPKNVTPGVVRVTEREPHFPGGTTAFNAYLRSRLESAGFTSGENGKLLVTFVVEKNGSVSTVKIIQGIEKNLNLAVIDAIRESPKWTPGYKEGKPVRALYKLPIIF